MFLAREVQCVEHGGQNHRGKYCGRELLPERCVSVKPEASLQRTVRAVAGELGELLAGDLCSGAVQNGEDAGA